MKKQNLTLIAVVAIIASLIGCSSGVPQEKTFKYPPVHDGSKTTTSTPPHTRQPSNQPPSSSTPPASRNNKQSEGYDMDPSIRTPRRCKENTDCFNGSLCIHAQCVTVKHTWDCAIDADCGNGLVCNWGRCKDPFMVGFKSPKQLQCRKDYECSVLNDRSTCTNVQGHMTCSKDWAKEQGAVKGCEVDYDFGADHFKLWDADEKRFDGKMKVVILAINKDGSQYVAISKSTARNKTVVIPTWAQCYKLLDPNTGYFISMYQCVGSHATIRWMNKTGVEGGWICRNSPF